MAWWRSPAIPATALVIGNPQMQDTGWETHIKSIAGALPIMLGDPRKLSEADLKKYRGYADWLQPMEIKYEHYEFSVRICRASENQWKECGMDFSG